MTSRVRIALVAATLLVALIGGIVWVLGAGSEVVPGGGSGRKGADAGIADAAGAVVAQSAPLRTVVEPSADHERKVGGRTHRLSSRILDYHTGVPIEDVEVVFSSFDESLEVSGVSDSGGLVTLTVALPGPYVPSIKSFGWVLPRSGGAVTACPADIAQADIPSLKAIAPFASGVKVNGRQPYDGVFEWDRPLQVVGSYNLDLQGLQRNVLEARRMHGVGTQVYALAHPVPMSGMATLFFEHRGAVRSPVLMSKLVGFVPTEVDTDGLPASDGAAGYVTIAIGSVEQDGPEVGPFYLVRAQPISGYQGTRVKSGTKCPVPPGDYSLSGKSLTFPWLFPELTSPGGSIARCAAVK